MGRCKAWMRGHIVFAATAVISVGLLFLHVWLNVDPRLVYHRQGPLFFTGWSFFREHLARAGGLAEYVSALLGQFHWLGWPGAAVMAALALMIAVCVRAILGRLGGRWTWPAVAPVALLAILANRFDHPLTTWVGLAAVLALTTAYVWAAPRWAPGRAALFAVLAMLGYYVAGAPMFVFAAIAAIAELARPKAPAPARRGSLVARGLFALGFLAWAAAAPYAAGWFFEIPTREAYTLGLAFMLAHDPAALFASIGLYAIPPLAAAVAAFWPRRAPWTPANRWLRRIAGPSATAAVLVAGAILALRSLDPLERSFLRIDWYTQEARWADVLAEAAAHPQPAASVQLHVIQALHHSGRLLDDLFRLPLPAEERGTAPSLVQFSRFAAYAQSTRLLLELGRVGEAEHAAYEALETLGERPEILRSIVLINILKGQPDAARPPLGLLEKTLWHADWARQCRARLAADPSMGDDAEVRRIRGLMSPNDLVGDANSESRLLDLLRANPANRMAAEYLMVLHLLGRRSDRVAENLLVLRQCGMTELPRHVQEAVVHFAWLRRDRRDQGAPLLGFRLAPEIRDGLPRYKERLRQYERDPVGAWNALKNDYGATYWFYETFRCTPFGRQGPPPVAVKESPR